MLLIMSPLMTSPSWVTEEGVLFAGVYEGGLFRAWRYGDDGATYEWAVALLASCLLDYLNLSGLAFCIYNESLLRGAGDTLARETKKGTAR